MTGDRVGFFIMKEIWALRVFLMGTGMGIVWALYGHCMGTYGNPHKANSSQSIVNGSH